MKKGSYLTGVAIVIITLIAIIIVTGNSLLMYVDPMSLLIIVLLTLPIMIATFGWKDYWNAFRLAFARDPANPEDYARAGAIIGGTIRTLYLTAALGTFTGVIGILVHMRDDLGINVISLNYAVALLAIFYGLVLHLTLLEPIRSYLRREALSNEAEDSIR